MAKIIFKPSGQDFLCIEFGVLRCRVCTWIYLLLIFKCAFDEKNFFRFLLLATFRMIIVVLFLLFPSFLQVYTLCYFMLHILQMSLVVYLQTAGYMRVYSGSCDHISIDPLMSAFCFRTKRQAPPLITFEWRLPIWIICKKIEFYIYYTCGNRRLKGLEKRKEESLTRAANLVDATKCHKENTLSIQTLWKGRGKRENEKNEKE